MVSRRQVAELGAKALRRITEAPLTDQKKFLLADCVEAYLPLDEQQQREYERLMLGTPQTKVKAMNKTSFDKGLESGIEKGREEGIEKGIEKGIQKTILRQGTRRFGPPSNEIEGRIRALHDETSLEELSERILDVKSWDELLESVLKGL